VAKHYFVVVAELRDMVPRRNQKFPNLFVSVQQTKDDEQLHKTLREHLYYGAVVKTIRTDLNIRRAFLTPKNASVAAWQLKKRLARDGYTVNPSVDAEYRV